MERFGIADIKEFLTKNLHYLICHTKVDPFLHYLRSNMVLSEDDQEKIQAITTTRDRTATLIDTISYKGEKGFLSYMQVLEWVYPEAFTKITDITAEKPPKDFGSSGKDARVSRTSVMLIQELHKCMGVFLKDKVEQKLDIAKLNKTVDQLELENEIMLTDISNLESKLKEYQNIFDDYKASKKNLLEKVKVLEKENQILNSKLNDNSPNGMVDLYLEGRSVKDRVEQIDSETYLTEEKHFYPTTFNGNATENDILKEEIRQLLEYNMHLKNELKNLKEGSFCDNAFLQGEKEPLRASLSCTAVQRKNAVKIKRGTNSEA